MNKKTILIAIVSMFLLAAGCTKKTPAPVPAAEQKMEKKNEKEAMKEEKIMDKKNEVPPNQSDKSSGVGQAQKEMENEPQYADYSEDQIKDANSDGKKTVLFFHAPWCPSCKQANLDFTGNMNLIPKNIVVLKTDYDTSKELKKKYGVTYQHTFVQIDKNGDMVTKWVGGGVEELNKNIK